MYPQFSIERRITILIVEGFILSILDLFFFVLGGGGDCTGLVDS